MTELDTDIQKLNPENFRKEIIRLRNAIREHRDQVGDDRCWLDDVLLHGFLPDTPLPDNKLPSWEEMECKCRRFFEDRQCPSCPHQALTSRKTAEECDRDLAEMNDDALRQEGLRLRQGIHAHRDRTEKRTYADDEQLYALLPDGVLGDTRLTGDAFLPNCRRFWETRQNQNPQKLHEW